MEDLFILIEKLISNKITSEESLKLQNLCSEFQIDKEKLISLYRKKWDEAKNFDKVEVDKKDKVWKSIQSELNQSHFKSRKESRFNWLKIAAAVLLLLFSTGIGVYIYNSKKSIYSNDFTVITENGQKAKLELPDGTLVWLNSESKISYTLDFGKKNRIVNLIGEAYFEVNKETNKPFIVQAANDFNVKALGTKFNVKSYENDDVISSALIEGKIEVSNGLHSTILNPNEEIAINKKEGTFFKSKIDNSEEKIYWIGHNLIFKDEALSNIVKILERMYEVEFHFENEDISKIKYTGEIKNTELNNILNIISIVSPVKFESKNSDIVIKAKPKK